MHTGWLRPLTIGSLITPSIRLAVATVCLSTAAAFASPTTIGLYLDELGASVCDSTAVGSPQIVYLILKHPVDASGIIGWQGRLSTTPNVYVLGVTLRGMALNVGSGNDFRVGLSQPLPGDQVVILAELSVLALAAGGLRFDRLVQDSFISPVYITADDSDTLVPMSVEFGGVSGPSLTLGPTACPVPSADGAPVSVETLPWGAVKSIYR